MPADLRISLYFKEPSAPGVKDPGASFPKKGQHQLHQVRSIHELPGRVISEDVYRHRQEEDIQTGCGGPRPDDRHDTHHSHTLLWVGLSILLKHQVNSGLVFGIWETVNWPEWLVFSDKWGIVAVCTVHRMAAQQEDGLDRRGFACLQEAPAAPYVDCHVR